MAQEFSIARKVMYYVGFLLIVLGLACFFWAAMSFVDLSQELGPFGFLPTFGGRFFTGFALLLLGALLRKIGARGLAGSGILLDARMAHEDLEPYARIGGGLLKDGLEQAELRPRETDSEPEVRVRCQECRQLNLEEANFCQECGTDL